MVGRLIRERKRGNRPRNGNPVEKAGRRYDNSFVNTGESGFGKSFGERELSAISSVFRGFIKLKPYRFVLRFTRSLCHRLSGIRVRNLCFPFPGSDVSFQSIREAGEKILTLE